MYNYVKFCMLKLQLQGGLVTLQLCCWQSVALLWGVFGLYVHTYTHGPGRGEKLAVFVDILKLHDY